MPMSNEAKDLWKKLWDKLLVLEDAKKRFDMIPVDLKPDYGGIISSTFSEMELVRATMSFLVNGGEVPFPSNEQIAALQNSVGQLAQIVHVTNEVAELIPAVTEVLNSWPVSSPG